MHGVLNECSHQVIWIAGRYDSNRKRIERQEELDVVEVSAGHRLFGSKLGSVRPAQLVVVQLLRVQRQPAPIPSRCVRTVAAAAGLCHH